MLPVACTVQFSGVRLNLLAKVGCCFWMFFAVLEKQRAAGNETTRQRNLQVARQTRPASWLRACDAAPDSVFSC